MRSDEIKAAQSRLLDAVSIMREIRGDGYNEVGDVVRAADALRAALALPRESPGGDTAECHREVAMGGDRVRMVRVKAWPDCRVHGDWGVEVDDPSLTFDGHYICTTGFGEEGRRRAEVIADAINGRRTPMREVRDAR